MTSTNESQDHGTMHFADVISVRCSACLCLPLKFISPTKFLGVGTRKVRKKRKRYIASSPNSLIQRSSSKPLSALEIMSSPLAERKEP
jgi:hypothetical protein